MRKSAKDYLMCTHTYFFIISLQVIWGIFKRTICRHTFVWDEYMTICMVFDTFVYYTSCIGWIFNFKK